MRLLVQSGSFRLFSLPYLLHTKWKHSSHPSKWVSKRNVSVSLLSSLLFSDPLTFFLPAILDESNMWTFCPSLPVAMLFSILFGLTTITHIYQARKYRTPFCWTIIMGAIWETASFVIRCISIQKPTSEGAYDPHFILFLLAPLWINAFDYMLLGRMVHFYLGDRRLFRIRAERMTLCFVVLDVV